MENANERIQKSNQSTKHTRKNRKDILEVENPTLDQRINNIKVEGETARLECSWNIWQQKLNITIECLDIENTIKSVVAVNCEHNNSLKTAQYLFFGKVGVANANKNFYFYCQ